MQVWPTTRIRVHTALAAVPALAALLAAIQGALPWWASTLGLGVSVSWYLVATARYRRRRTLVAAPFPEPWRKILERRVPFYRDLDDAGRARFEDDVRIFLGEQRIYGAGQGQDRLEIGDETRLLIAASAAMLGHGMPDYDWPNLRDIVVHPRAFDQDYQSDGDGDDNISGMVHYQGPILYSERDLRRGFRRHDGHNVGLHELAHVLDLADGHADGHPIGADWVSTAPWMEIITDRLGKLRRHQYPHVLR
ncbi:MAG: zinc-dependent peptidase, partial [Myxococcales bacterium]|nr:zinc-dependent peptidase [Myxococcales bacterium]